MNATDFNEREGAPLGPIPLDRLASMMRDFGTSTFVAWPEQRVAAFEAEHCIIRNPDRTENETGNGKQ